MPTAEELTQLEDEVCPVCKLDAYMNPSMRFLISTECYHKMCESCVDRIYSTGPAPCPHTNCNRILRKNRFKRQTFADVGVEREVDVRKRVARVFNKRPEQFASLRDYNDYLEEVESAIFNLVNKVDVEATEAKLRKYESENRSTIHKNAALQSREMETAELARQLEERHRIDQRKAAIEESRAEQELKRDAERKLIQDLANASEGDAEIIMRKSAASMQRGLALKKSSARRGTKDAPTSKSFETTALAMLSAREKLAAPSSLPIYSPFNAIARQYYANDLYTVRSHYYDPFLDSIEHDAQAKAAGFTVKNVYEQVLFDAFMGIGCMIEEEKALPSQPATS
ncbi:CDK-activating kinase assembly factor MAT1-domain-containing protein [Limtongia smithiae]|uniref:CDK-activating kinase assembly factor MAT1-domain-containing protein n=1 Tax=Limtongia smithiae TaxID=1125753 RepID=UPI0034CD8905